MNNRIIKGITICLLMLFILPDVHAQIGKITIDLQKDKPTKFKDKQLRSEKTGNKKFTIPRRFIQNTTSHYNYYFNADHKLKSVIELARMASRDDYSQLIPYYSYSLTNTAAQKNELDSVILKATAGILLHDLRSNWVDDLYLLIGEAYYLRKDFDSASMTFQFINFNLTPGKNKEDEQLVGSNESGNSHALSVSSKEDRNVIDKVLSKPPARNDALVWQIRALTDMGEYGEAAGLINTLRNDPEFPERLVPFLNEVEGYWFFQQKMYDSAVGYIKDALPNALDMADRARREFLLGQLYEMQDKQDTASEYYDLAIHHTTDPLMDIYANVNKAKMLKSHDTTEINNSIARLQHMARKDKYEPYKDIIYYSAAELAMEKPDTATALHFYKGSTLFNEMNLPLKNTAFLKMGEIYYHQRNYKQAYNSFDSINVAGDSSIKNVAEIETRKKALAQVVRYLDIIQREDSLQVIAGMTADERESFLKNLSKKLMKERGVKETEANGGYNYFASTQSAMNLNNKTGEWYFDNNNLKSQGYTEFKRIWGKRQNMDNWRLNGAGRSASNMADMNRAAFGDPMAPQTDSTAEQITAAPVQQDISVQGLLANVPLTKPAMDTSNSKIAMSLFHLGKNYQNILEDYYAAIQSYEESLHRFPDSLYNGELYMNLFYCYNKIGEGRKADQYKNLLVSKFNDSKFAQYVLHPEVFNPSDKDTAAAHRYDNIYNLFIEGNFAQALKEKEEADSLYGKSYWNPQLLYIESVYYIQKRQDSAAIAVLHQIIDNYPKSPMKDKAGTMIDVLSRRDSIEKYLTNLQVKRLPEDSQIVVYDDAKIVNNVKTPVVQQQKPLVQKEAVKAGKAELSPEKKLPPPIKNAVFTFDPNEPQYVMMVLTKVDPVYSSEARNAFTRYNSQSYNTNKIVITKDTLDAERTLLIFASFDNADAAIKYRDKVKQDAPVQVSWLPAQKYSFYIISENNLELLKENKNLQSYLDLLNKKYPGKF